MLAEVVSACSAGAVLTGWALHLGVQATSVGLIVAAPQLAQMAHLPAAWMTTTFGRRRVALTAVALSRQSLLPLVLLPFVDWQSSTKVGVLGAVVALSSLTSVIGNNGWVAWMGDLVPHRVRGRYFGRRNAACTLAGSLAAVASGLALDRLGAGEARGHVLSALAALACIAGGATTLLMARQHAVPESRCGFAPGRLLGPLRAESTRRLLRYQLAWHGALGLASGLFAFYMVEHLHMGFMLVALHSACLAAVRMLASPFWGRVIDRAGAKPVLTACSFGIAILPALYVLASPSFLWPLALEAVLSGLFWSGHALAAFALPLAITAREDRPIYHALSGSACGLAFASGAATAGFILARFPAQLELGSRVVPSIAALFLLSSLARLAAATLAPRTLEPGAQTVRTLVQAYVRAARGDDAPHAAP